MHDPMPSSPGSVRSPGSVPNPDTSGAWRAQMDAKMTDFDARLSGSGGPEPSIKDRLEELQRCRDDDRRVLKAVSDAVGESPDAATGREGSGMRKQLASLIEAHKRPTIASYMAAVGTAILALYQILKGAGVLK